jgi:hypothetical protein
MNLIFDPNKHKIFTPINIDKYMGQVYPIARSSWEIQYMQWLDMNPNVIEWCSESIAIEYFSRVKKKKRKYYPDFIIKVRDKNGDEKIFLVEIKPYKEVIPPKISRKKSTHSKIYESTTYITNCDKWNAAEKYCKKHNMIFKILTEKDLFINEKN